MQPVTTSSAPATPSARITSATAARQLRARNAGIEVRAVVAPLGADNVDALVAAADLVLDWQAATAERPMGLVLSVPRLALNDLALGPARLELGHRRGAARRAARRGA